MHSHTQEPFKMHTQKFLNQEIEPFLKGLDLCQEYLERMQFLLLMLTY